MNYETREKWKRRIGWGTKMIFKAIKWLFGIIFVLAIVAYAINHPSETFNILKELGRIMLNIVAWIGEQLARLGST